MTLSSRIAFVTGQGSLAIDRIEVPETVPGGIVAEVVRAGLCGTDLHLLDDATPVPGNPDPYPIAMGHEIVVRICDIGDGAPEVDSYGQPLRVGDRVVFGPSAWACGHCYACRILLAPNNCLHPARTDGFPDILAGFADYVVIPPGSEIFRVPESMSDATAVLAEPMAGASRAFMRAARPGVPDRGEGFGIGGSVAIQGAGAIGALMTILAKNAGAQFVAVIGEPAERRALCEQLGADLTIGLDSSAEERREAIAARTPLSLGVDVVLEASGAPSALGEAMDLARIEGTIVEFGAYTSRGPAEVDASVLCRKDLNVYGSHGYGPGQFGMALRILERLSDTVDFDSLVTHNFPLDDLADAFGVARTGEAVKATVTP